VGLPAPAHEPEPGTLNEKRFTRLGPL